VEPEELAVARQQLNKHVSVAMDMQATIKELLETMFSMQSMLRIYSESH
jgi:ribosome-interacting GTPase 1